MATELKTFRFERDVLQQFRDVCKRRGDLSWHINEAMRIYIDKFGKPEPKKVISTKIEKSPVVSNLADEVIDRLNDQAGTNYRKTDTNRKLIFARLKDFTVNECYTVIDKKCAEWKGTEFGKYLRPSTLFQASKFEEYLNQSVNAGVSHGNQSRQSLTERSDADTREIQALIETGHFDNGTLGQNDPVIPPPVGLSGGRQDDQGAIDAEFHVVVPQDGMFD